MTTARHSTPPRHRARGRVARTARRTARPGAAVLLVLACGLSLGGVAAAYFSSDGTGTGSVSTGVLNAPTNVEVLSDPGTGLVDISWVAPSDGVVPEGYHVRRIPSSGPMVDACGTSAASPTVATHCVDENVPLGTYTYVVVALRASWTATSTSSDAVVVGQAAQTITFTSAPPDPTYDGPTYTAAADGGASGNPVTFTSGTPAVCTSSGTHGATVTFVGAGTCTVLADQAGSDYHAAAAQAEQTFEVAKAAQAITFTSTAPADAAVGGSGYAPTATGGGSGNPVVLTVSTTAAANCSLSGGVLTYLKAGTCTVDANQSGDANHAAAPQVQQSFAISPAAQAITITSTAPADAKVGDSYALTATGGGSGNPVVLATTSGAVCTLAPTGPGAATVSFVAEGTCVLTANQAGNDDYLAAGEISQSISVTRKTQTITDLTAPSAPAYLGGYTVAATGGDSTNPVTFSTTTPAVCTSSGTHGATIAFVGAGTCTVEADQAGNANYLPAPTASVTFAVAKATQSLTFDPVSPANAGTAAPLTATSDRGLTTFTFSTSSSSTVCTVAGNQVSYVGAGTCQLTVSQAGTANVEAATASANVTVTAVVDTQAPTIVAIEPGNETGGWNAIACSVDLPGNEGRICVTATDNVGVAGVSITLTKANGRCWSGTGSSSSFDASDCATPVQLTLSGGRWISNPLVRQGGGGQPNFTNADYTLEVTVRDAANNTVSATRTFTVTGG